MSEQKANIGVVGMAVMGSNLARNLAHHGYTVAIYNRTFAKTQQVLADHGDEATLSAARRSKDSSSQSSIPARSS